MKRKHLAFDETVTVINRTSYTCCFVGVELGRCVCEAVLLHTVFVGDLYADVKIVLILSYVKSV
jgi:hypothetical protein